MKDKIREIILKKLKDFGEIGYSTSLEDAYGNNKAQAEEDNEFADYLTDALYNLMRLDLNKAKELTTDLVDKHFPKGECKERGQAIVLYAEMLIAICDNQDTLYKEK